MGNPPMMELPIRDSGFSEVLVILATNSRHRLLEAGKLILQVLKGVHQNVQLS